MNLASSYSFPRHIILLSVIAIFNVTTAIADCRDFIWNSSTGNVTASSFKSLHGPNKARLNSDSSWSPAQSVVGEWLMVDLGKVMILTGTALQAPADTSGRKGAMVASFYVYTSLDNTTWTPALHDKHLAKLLTGVTKDTDKDAVFNNTLKPVLARFVKVLPQTWVSEIAMRIGLYGCSSGIGPLGMASGKLLNYEQISASSELNGFHRAASARPNARHFWCTAMNDLKQFLQVDFIKTVLLTGLEVRGLTDHDYGTKSFLLNYKKNIGELWRTYPGLNGSMIFYTSINKKESVLHVLATFVPLRSVRLNPRTWKSRICLKVEFYGIYEAEMQNCDNSTGCTEVAVCKILSRDAPDFKYCVCQDGYLGNGLHCIDYDECVYSDRPCNTDELCINEPGSFKCLCNAGYTRRGDSCLDIDECRVGNFSCPRNTICDNTEGSYKCKCDPVGFYSVGEKCIDINECTKQSNRCHQNAECINSVGSYLCFCTDGFTGDGRLSCSDVNECSENPTNCHSDASCVNDQGSYHCSCKQGFTGNGELCQDIDECEIESGCDKNALCINYAGSYVCECITGYKAYTKSTCVDINECQLNTDDCHKFSNCFNTAGSYMCVCKDGYYGDGRTCSKSRPAVHCLRPEAKYCDP